MTLRSHPRWRGRRSREGAAAPGVASLPRTAGVSFPDWAFRDWAFRDWAFRGWAFRGCGSV